MKLQRFFWFVNRFTIHLVLIALSAVIIAALTNEKWLLSLFFGILFLVILYKWLIRLKILKNSVVVRHGRVFFFVPETTGRDRADFVTRGQTVVHLPEYQILDRPFKVELFFPGRERSISSCRLSLRLAYSLEPAAWQRAYDSFVEHGELLPQEVKRVLLQSCSLLKLEPADISGESALQEYLVPIISQVNLGLECVGLEVVDVQCSFTEDLIFARFLAVDQQDFENRPAETVFNWHIRGEEGAQRPSGALLGVDGTVVR